LWANTADAGAKRAHDGFLMTAKWPELPKSLIDAGADAEVAFVIDVISEGRSIRAGLNVPLSAKPPLLIIEGSDAQRGTWDDYGPQVAQMLRVSHVEAAAVAPPGAIPFVVDGATFALPVAEFIDIAAERTRLTKEVANLAGEIDKIGKKLGNADFVARAPEEVIEENRERLADAETAKAKLEGALARLGAA
jgi:valyl-tRNA synthetase